MIVVIENYFNWLDLSIYCAKSCCMRNGKKFNCPGADIITRTGEFIPWINEIRYLDIYILLLRVNSNAIFLMPKELFVEQSTPSIR
jgi:hypothetical protein